MTFREPIFVTEKRRRAFVSSYSITRVTAHCTINRFDLALAMSASIEEKSEIPHRIHALVTQ